MITFVRLLIQMFIAAPLHFLNTILGRPTIIVMSRPTYTITMRPYDSAMSPRLARYMSDSIASQSYNSIG